ncbi:Hypothetical_protein [Hexamita inflata]|uniref:Hypothetical_protein n=1 Tax=Hexamita inflata TaxID=28002 RepID=A0ABP1GJ51_9EUKA
MLQQPQITQSFRNLKTYIEKSASQHTQNLDNVSDMVFFLQSKHERSNTQFTSLIYKQQRDISQLKETIVKLQKQQTGVTISPSKFPPTQISQSTQQIKLALMQFGQFLNQEISKTSQIASILQKRVSNAQVDQSQQLKQRNMELIQERFKSTNLQKQMQQVESLQKSQLFAQITLIEEFRSQIYKTNKSVGARIQNLDRKMEQVRDLCVTCENAVSETRKGYVLNKNKIKIDAQVNSFYKTINDNYNSQLQQIKQISYRIDKIGQKFYTAQNQINLNEVTYKSKSKQLSTCISFILTLQQSVNSQETTQKIKQVGSKLSNLENQYQQIQKLISKQNESQINLIHQIYQVFQQTQIILFSQQQLELNHSPIINKTNQLKNKLNLLETVVKSQIPTAYLLKENNRTNFIIQQLNGFQVNNQLQINQIESNLLNKLKIVFNSAQKIQIEKYIEKKANNEKNTIHTIDAEKQQLNNAQQNLLEQLTRITYLNEKMDTLERKLDLLQPFKQSQLYIQQLPILLNHFKLQINNNPAIKKMQTLQIKLQFIEQKIPLLQPSKQPIDIKLLQQSVEELLNDMQPDIHVEKLSILDEKLQSIQNAVNQYSASSKQTQHNDLTQILQNAQELNCDQNIIHTKLEDIGAIGIKLKNIEDKLPLFMQSQSLSNLIEPLNELKEQSENTNQIIEVLNYLKGNLQRVEEKTEALNKLCKDNDYTFNKHQKESSVNLTGICLASNIIKESSPIKKSGEIQMKQSDLQDNGVPQPPQQQEVVAQDNAPPSPKRDDLQISQLQQQQPEKQPEIAPSPSKQPPRDQSPPPQNSMLNQSLPQSPNLSKSLAPQPNNITDLLQLKTHFISVFKAAKEQKLLYVQTAAQLQIIRDLAFSITKPEVASAISSDLKLKVKASEFLPHLQLNWNDQIEKTVFKWFEKEYSKKKELKDLFKNFKRGTEKFYKTDDNKPVGIAFMNLHVILAILGYEVEPCNVEQGKVLLSPVLRGEINIPTIQMKQSDLQDNGVPQPPQQQEVVAQDNAPPSPKRDDLQISQLQQQQPEKQPEIAPSPSKQPPRDQSPPPQNSMLNQSLPQSPNLSKSLAPQPNNITDLLQLKTHFISVFKAAKEQKLLYVQTAAQLQIIRDLAFSITKPEVASAISSDLKLKVKASEFLPHLQLNWNDQIEKTVFKWFEKEYSKKKELKDLFKNFKRGTEKFYKTDDNKPVGIAFMNLHVILAILGYEVEPCNVEQGKVLLSPVLRGEINIPTIQMKQSDLQDNGVPQPPQQQEVVAQDNAPPSPKRDDLQISQLQTAAARETARNRSVSIKAAASRPVSAAPEFHAESVATTIAKSIQIAGSTAKQHYRFALVEDPLHFSLQGRQRTKALVCVDSCPASNYTRSSILHHQAGSCVCYFIRPETQSQSQRVPSTPATKLERSN